MTSAPKGPLSPANMINDISTFPNLPGDQAYLKNFWKVMGSLAPGSLLDSDFLRKRNEACASAKSSGSLKTLKRMYLP